MPKGVLKTPQTRACSVCGSVFAKTGFSQKYCSKACKREQYKVDGPETTERQYALISGNWEKYFSRLCQRSFRRELLSKHDCVMLLEQQKGRCALTGIELTCRLEKGVVCKTNASIDRIDPKGPYTKENVQLVCAAINKLRIDMSIDEFIGWCRKVANHAVCE